MTYGFYNVLLMTGSMVKNAENTLIILKALEKLLHNVEALIIAFVEFVKHILKHESICLLQQDSLKRIALPLQVQQNILN